MRALLLPPPLRVSYPDFLSQLPNASHYEANGGQSLMTGFITVNNCEYCCFSPRILGPSSSVHSQSTGSVYTHQRNSIGAFSLCFDAFFPYCRYGITNSVRPPPKVQYAPNVPTSRDEIVRATQDPVVSEEEQPSGRQRTYNYPCTTTISTEINRSTGLEAQKKLGGLDQRRQSPMQFLKKKTSLAQ